MSADSNSVGDRKAINEVSQVSDDRNICTAAYCLGGERKQGEDTSGHPRALHLKGTGLKDLHCRACQLPPKHFQTCFPPTS